MTLRSGVGCIGFNNQLDVIDISDISDPELIRSYPMENPYGLGIDDGLLFVADGHAGVKVFDATDPAALVKKDQLNQVESRDVILDQGIAIVTGPEGIAQFDYSDIENIELISVIEVSPEGED